jgi:hypothetical protein
MDMNNEFITVHFYILLEVRGFHCSENRDTLSYYMSQDNAEISFVSLRYGALHTLVLHIRLTLIYMYSQVVQIPAHHIGSTNEP